MTPGTDQIARLRQELDRIVSQMATGRVKDRGQMAVRARELDHQLRRLQAQETPK